MQTIRVHTRNENDATASTGIQRRKSEKFWILVNLFAQIPNLPQQQPATPLPPALTTENLLIDPDLWQDGNTASQVPDNVSKSSSMSDAA